MTPHRSIFSGMGRPRRAALRPMLLASCLLAVVVAGCQGCSGGKNGATGNGGGGAGNGPDPAKVTPGSPEYQKMASLFFTGAVFLETAANGEDKDQIVASNLIPAAQLVPAEPAVHADLGLFYLRQGKLDEAAKELQLAHDAKPDNSQIEFMLNALAERRGKYDEATQHLRKAIELDPANLKARYALVSAKRPGGVTDPTETKMQLQAILKGSPGNLLALTDMAAAAGRANDAAMLRDALQGVRARASQWPANVDRAGLLARLTQLDKLAADNKLADVDGLARGVQNLLKATTAFQQDQTLIYAGDLRFADPIEQFLVLKPVPSTPAAPDLALDFTPQPITGAEAAKEKLVEALEIVPENRVENLEGSSTQPTPVVPPATVLADGNTLKIVPASGSPVSVLFPGGKSNAPLGPENVCMLDANYDYLPDLALAGAGGFRLYLQNPDHTFRDATTATKLPPSVVNGAYTGAYAVDIESDGDLDIVLTPFSGPPIVLQNNGDNTFAVIKSFSGIANARAFALADLDNDGDADVAMLDNTGKLHLWENLRGGHYREWPVPAAPANLAALAVADTQRRGQVDLVALGKDGSIVRIGRKTDGTDWETTELARGTTLPTDGSARVFVADLDNNGAVDLVISSSTGTQIFLADSETRYVPLPAKIPARVFNAANLGGQGRLDLVGIDTTGPTRLANKGTKNYAWQVMRTRVKYDRENSKGGPTGPEGDKRVNAFGIGGEIAARAALLYQKVPITGPSTHFGLGENARLDAARIVWPNGVARGEFALKQNEAFVAVYRLGTSCPWLYAYNGTDFQLVTDCIWRSPLGLAINAQVTAGITQTEDWIKIRGDQLAPHEGAYDLRICAELWETHFFDHLALMAVDHPDDSDIWIDERFSIPPPPLAVITTAHPVPVARATDDRGTNVTDIVRTFVTGAISTRLGAANIKA